MGKSEERFEKFRESFRSFLLGYFSEIVYGSRRR